MYCVKGDWVDTMCDVVRVITMNYWQNFPPLPKTCDSKTFSLRYPLPL
jgi:hypothetical protein